MKKLLLLTLCLFNLSAEATTASFSFLEKKVSQIHGDRYTETNLNGIAISLDKSLSNVELGFDAEYAKKKHFSITSTDLRLGHKFGSSFSATPYLVLSGLKRSYADLVSEYLLKAGAGVVLRKDFDDKLALSLIPQISRSFYDKVQSNRESLSTTPSLELALLLSPLQDKDIKFLISAKTLKDYRFEFFTENTIKLGLQANF